MNIWIFNHYAHGPDLPGGTRHYDLGKELVQRGHQVTIFASSFHHYLHKETRLRPGERWKVEDIDGVKFVWIRTPPYQSNDRQRVKNMVVFSLRVWWWGKRSRKFVSEIGSPDVIIGSSPHLFTPLAAYLVSKHHRSRFLLEIRDLWPKVLVDIGSLGEANPIVLFLKLLEKFLYVRSSKIVVLGSHMQRYIADLGVDRSKISWIPNGVIINFANNVDSSEASDEFRVLYLGAHSPSNPIWVILKAADIVKKKGFKNIKFVFVGSGPDKPKLMDMADQMELDNVHFEESVSKMEVPNVLQGSDVLVLVKVKGFSDLGGSVLKLFDYMASGKPVLVSGSIPDNPVERASCGFILPPENPEALADAIIKLYKMPSEEREAMGKRGREYVEKYHAIPVLADKLERVLKEVVDGR